MVFGLDWGLGLGLWWYLGGEVFGKKLLVCREFSYGAKFALRLLW